MAKKGYKKGHPNYYHGKKVKAELFAEVWNAHANGEISLSECARRLNVTNPTMTKWRNQLILAGFDLNRVTFIDYE